jgi:inner membrane protein
LILGSRFLPVVLLAVVVVVDAWRDGAQLDLLRDAVTDELAHAATALIALLALAGPVRLIRASAFTSAAVLGSVLIDLDHLPIYAGLDGYAHAGRPYSHSLATVTVLLVLSRAVPAVSQLCAGAAAGVLLHLLRDAATGPGVPLLWPSTTHHVLVPYAAYLALTAGLAACAVCRAAVRPGSGADGT